MTKENQGIVKKSETLYELSIEDKKILLIGTAHVSRKSAEEVESLIFEEGADTVAIELCPSRFESIKEADRWKNMDVLKVIKEKKVFLLLANLLMAAFQKKVADKMEVRPGEEMLRAIDAAEKNKAEIYLADREIRITLARLWRKMSFIAKTKLIFQLFASSFSAGDIEEEEIEKLKNQDLIASLTEEIAGMHPMIQKVLIDERDLYLAQKIRRAPGKKIIAVVGAGHIKGILSYIEEERDIEDLELMPEASKLGKILKWGLPAFIVLLFILGFFFGGKNIGGGMISTWIIANSCLAGAGALLALAHPLTIITAMLAAPLTSLNPAMAAGWVAGFTEAYLRKPKVSDMQALSEDISSLKGFWKNKATRILLVVALTNIGSSLGTLVALPIMARLLG